MRSTDPASPVRGAAALRLLRALGCASLAVACAGLLVAAGVRHPFAPWWPSILVAGWGVCAFLLPGWRVTLLIALLPCVDLAPFSGWIFVDDYDFLILAALAAGYAAMALERAPPGADRAAGSRAGRWLIAAYGLALLASAAIGYTTPEFLSGEAITPYFSHFNALRLLKAPAFAMLLLPLAAREARLRPATFRDECVRGVLAALALACLTVLWERSAFGMLTDLASDYRVTGFFSGTHTGGAALDGFLAFATPFVVLGLFRTTGAIRLALLALLAVCAAYAILVTFSRGLYAAVALATTLQVLLWTRHATRRDAPAPMARGPHRILALPLLAAAVWLLEAGFSSGGYRGMAAMAALATACFAIGGVAPKWNGRLLASTLLLGGMVAGTAWLAPKGVYLAFGVAVAATLWALTGDAARAAHAAWPALLALAATAAGICVNWAPAGTPTGATLVAAGGALVLAAANTATRNRLWQVTPVSLPVLLFALAAGAGVVIVQNAWFATARFSTARKDLAGRFEHWSAVLAARKTDAPHALFGNGLGRVPDALFWINEAADLPGVYGIEREGDNAFLRLRGSRYRIGYGDPLRIMQAMVVDAPRARITLRARNMGGPAALKIEFCTRHLIYGFDCRGDAFLVAQDRAWHEHAVPVDLSVHAFRDAFPPRPVFLVIQTESQKALIDIDDVAVSGLGRPLANGGFESGMDRWFFTSDRIHLAWHAKNLPLHVLLEQGLAGLALLAALAGIAAWRTLRAAWRASTTAAAALAAMSALFIVGLFDSLVDVPRIALMFYVPLFALCAWPDRTLFAAHPGRRAGTGAAAARRHDHDATGAG